MRFPLEISPDPVSLGIVRSGQKASASLTLANPGTRVVTIESIETSCSCLKIASESIRIGPGESKALALEFDSSEEPDFHGGLSIDVTGYAGGVVAFVTLVNVQVEPKPPDEAGNRVRPLEVEAGL